MKSELNRIEKILEDLNTISKDELNEVFKTVFKKITNHIDNYIGDFPTFIEPVYLEHNVEIGDDVLIGPNVYIGKDVKIGDYVELSNSIIFDQVRLGNNLKLEKCIVTRNSQLTLKNFKSKSTILSGKTNSENDIKKITF